MMQRRGAGLQDRDRARFSPASAADKMRVRVQLEIIVLESTAKGPAAEMELAAQV
jgi:hypothetical protein